MNRIAKVMLFVGTLLMLASCKKDDPKPSAEEQQLEMLRGTWKTNSVTVDGTNISDQYKDFALTVFKDQTGTKLVATNGGYAFPSIGVDTWSFVEGSDASKIKRLSDNVEIAIQVTATNLTLDFTIATSSAGGRTRGLEGHFVFVLSKS